MRDIYLSNAFLFYFASHSEMLRLESIKSAESEIIPSSKHCPDEFNLTSPIYRSKKEWQVNLYPVARCIRNRIFSEFVVMSQIKVACFLSPTDENLIQKVYLNNLTREPGIKVEFFDELLVGTEKGSAEANLVKTADVTVLFLSQYLSGFFYENIKNILQRKRFNSTELILVNLRPNLIKDDPQIRDLNFFPGKEDSIAAYENAENDQQWVLLSREIREAAARMQQKKRPKSKYTEIANLCNREDQQEQLKDAFRRQFIRKQQTSKLAPLICFVHGSPEQHLDNYRERLEKTELKRILRVDHVEYLQEKRFSVRRSDLTDMTKYLFDDLALRLLGRKAADEFHGEYEEYELKKEFGEIAAGEKNPAEINLVEKLKTRLSALEAPLMISYMLETSNWNPVDRGSLIKEPSLIIKEFLQFWNQIGALELNSRIIVCVFFAYKKFGEQSLEMLNENARNFFEGKAVSPVGGRGDVFAFPNSWFPGVGTYHDESFENLCGVILDELPPVTFYQVEDWLMREEKIESFCSQHQPFCDREVIIEEVKQFYGVDTGIDRPEPMIHVTEVLIEQFERFGCCDLG
jgi:hypothetical protein